jgi:TonB family protein
VGCCALGLLLSLTLETARASVEALEGEVLSGRAYCKLGDRLLRSVARASPKAAAEAATQAEEAFSKALEVGDTDRAEAWSGIARARLQREFYAGAEAAARAAIEADVDGRETPRARAMICVARRARPLLNAIPPLPPSVAQAMVDPAGDYYYEALHVGGKVAKPSKVYGLQPVYTEKARKAHVQGVVVLETIIGRDGCLSHIHVLKGLPDGLDRAALMAVENWVFDPATLDGKPVKVYYTLTVNFQVQ